ncbi:MAG: tetratricopeptide repeat protein [Nitrospinaceae bacterium]|nr:tetratricopeptide repeat protein [Nitrospinaceae bacterium]
MSKENSSALITARPHAPWLWAAAIVVAACLAYWGTVSYPFLHDDLTVISENPVVQEGRVGEALTKDYWSMRAEEGGRDRLYRPLTTLSLIANRWLGGSSAGGGAPVGGSPVGFRVVNILLNALAALLLFWLALALGLSLRAAGAAGLLFAVHPLHTEAVLAVVGRADILAAIGVFGGAIILLGGATGTGVIRSGEARAAKRRGGKQNKSNKNKEVLGTLPRTGWQRAVALAGAFALALFSKETGAALVGLIVLWWGWHRWAVGPVRGGPKGPGSFAGDEKKIDKPSKNNNLSETVGPSSWAFALGRIEIFALGGVLGVYLVMRYLALGMWVRPGAASLLDNPLAHEALAGRLVGALGVMGRFFGLLVWSRPLAIDYSYAQILPWSPESLAWAAVGAGALGLWAWCAWRGRYVRHVAVFGLALFMAGYLPASNFLVPVGTVMAERLMYLPSAGFLLAVLPWIEEKVTKSGARAFLGALAAATLVFGAMSWERASEWSGYLKFWESAARVSPNSARAQRLWGQSLTRAGKFSEAVVPLKKATRIFPKYDPAWTELGIALMQVGKTKEAEATLREALRLNPRSPETLLAIGALFIKGGYLDQARIYFEKAVSLYPRFVEARFRLGNLYMKVRDNKRARVQYNMALIVAPGRGDIHHNMALTLYLSKDYIGARRHALIARKYGVKLHPEFARLIGLAKGGALERPVKKVK